MGMAASQARFLGLTARQNNVEFEGQQVNQQRTMLANQSANYYNDLLGMTVPTPPSVDNYTKTVYTFNNGALTNTVTAMIAKSNGLYTMSYISKWQDDYTPIAASTSVVNRKTSDVQLANVGGAGNYTYYVGATELRELASGIELIPPKAGDRTKDGKHIYVDDNGQLYTKSNECSEEEISKLEYYYFVVDPDEVLVDDEWLPYYIDDEGNKKQAVFSVNKNEDSYSYEDENGNTQQIDFNQVTMCLDLVSALSEEDVKFVEIDEQGNYLKEDSEAEFEYLSDEEIQDLSTVDTKKYPALEGMTQAEIKGMLKEEAAWKDLLLQKYGESDWLIRYQTDTTLNKTVPYFYSKASLEGAIYDDKTGNTLSAINCYTIGSEQKVSEFKGIEGCKLEKDSSGRLINISIPKTTSTGEIIYETFALTTETTTDQDAYKDAMNQYEYDKALYDQAVEKINTKIEIIQAEDKNLELRLKQLDTEQKAINTEKEAVQKVIEKNTQDTFKTFSA